MVGRAGHQEKGMVLTRINKCKGPEVGTKARDGHRNQTLKRGQWGRRGPLAFSQSLDFVPEMLSLRGNGLSLP